MGYLYFIKVFLRHGLFNRTKKKLTPFWLLREPVVHGTRLDVSSEATPGLMAALCGTRTVLEHIMAAAGPDLMGSEAVGSLLGICSVRAAENVLQLWKNRLIASERRLLADYGQGTEPDGGKPFLEIKLVAYLGDLDGPLLRTTKSFILHTVDKRTFDQNCVTVLNSR